MDGRRQIAELEVYEKIMPRIFHFISKSDLEVSLDNGNLRVPSLQIRGFIHCSLKDQVIDVANSIAPGKDDLVLLEIEESKVVPKIVYENLEGGEKLFPHIYGPLNEDAIIAIHPFKWKANTYVLPQ
jgi:uncharacterized protein (DUF952 family)